MPPYVKNKNVAIIFAIIALCILMFLILITVAKLYE